ncbi:hypothetical protein E8F06_06530 [Pseudomonas sp. BN411]|nr:hypothetical protein [Pseudomonas sp. BN411]
MRDGKDLFHRNVRWILDQCFPSLTFDEQLRKVWMTESVLCSASIEGGNVPASAWRACTASYLKPQIALFSRALVVALGNKAQSRLKSIAVPYLPAAAAAPPGCNFKGSRESWGAIAQELSRRRLSYAGK